jgi:hypothetical protein
MESDCTCTSRSLRSIEGFHALFCLQQQLFARKMPHVFVDPGKGLTMRSCDQSVCLYFDRPVNPAKRNQKRLLSDMEDVVVYAV